MKTPKPKLRVDRLYIGDNGRIFCGALRCAGQSAHFTGRTIAGQRVRQMTAADAERFETWGLVLKCEGCTRSFADVAVQAAVTVRP